MQLMTRAMSMAMFLKRLLLFLLLLHTCTPFHAHFNGVPSSPSSSFSRAYIINTKTEFEVSLELGLLGFVNDQPIVQGELNMKITSILPAGKSSIQTLSLPLPLGLDLEQSPEDGLIKVVDISGTASADGENIQIGDILRGVTAREKRMAYPGFQVAMGGIGKPQLVTSFIPCKRGIDLEYVLQAIGSMKTTATSHPDPAMFEEGKATLVLERPL